MFGAMGDSTVASPGVARAVVLGTQPAVRAEPGSLHPRNVFLPAARVPSISQSHAITAVDWSQTGVPYKQLATPLTPQVAFSSVTQPIVPPWQVKDTKFMGSRVIVKAARRQRVTGVVQQPQARGFKKTP